MSQVIIEYEKHTPSEWWAFRKLGERYARNSLFKGEVDPRNAREDYLLAVIGMVDPDVLPRPFSALAVGTAAQLNNYYAFGLENYLDRNHPLVNCNYDDERWPAVMRFLFSKIEENGQMKVDSLAVSLVAGSISLRA